MARQIDADTQPSLLLRLKNRQDEEAWRLFTEVYSPLVYNFCRMRGQQPNDAADITQEVLLRVARGIASFEYDQRQGLFRDWIARIVLNEIRRHGNRGKSEAALPEGHDVQVTEMWNEQFHQHILAEAMKRAQTQFNEDTWDLFKSTWVDRKSPSVTAQEFGVEVGNVYVARSRVLKRLRYEVSILADDFLG